MIEKGKKTGQRETRPFAESVLFKAQISEIYLLSLRTRSYTAICKPTLDKYQKSG